jgi:hypothetical protein
VCAPRGTSGDHAPCWASSRGGGQRVDPAASGEAGAHELVRKVRKSYTGEVWGTWLQSSDTAGAMASTNAIESWHKQLNTQYWPKPRAATDTAWMHCIPEMLMSLAEPNKLPIQRVVNVAGT